MIHASMVNERAVMTASMAKAGSAVLKMTASTTNEEAGISLAHVSDGPHLITRSWRGDERHLLARRVIGVIDGRTLEEAVEEEVELTLIERVRERERGSRPVGGLIWIDGRERPCRH